MKKIISITMITVLTLSLCACRSNTGTRNPYASPGTNNQGGMSGILPSTSPTPAGGPNGVNGYDAPVKDMTGREITGQGTAYEGQVQPGRRYGEGTSPGSAQGAAPTSIYKDGTYTGEGDARSSGKETAIVTISGGRISDIQLRRVDANGNDITDENVGLSNAPGGGSTANIGQTRRDLANNMIQNQTNEVLTSTTGDNDVVSNWKVAVGRALEKARNANNYR